MASSPQEQKTRSAKTAGSTTLIVALLTAELVSAFETSMIYIAIPTFMKEFSVDAAAAGWAVTAFLLVAAASAAICGRLGDVYGRKKLLMIVLVVSTIGSLVSFIFGNLEGIIIGRALQGVTGATLPLCFGLAREALPKTRVPGAIAIISGSAFIAGASGALIAGVLLNISTWHAIFIFSGVLGVIATVMAGTMLRPSLTSTIARQRIDILGGVLFAPAIALVLFGLTNASSWGILDTRTIGFVLGGLAVSAIWCWWELRVANPMINLRMLKSNKMGLTQLATALVNLGPNVALPVLTPLILLSTVGSPVGLGMSSTMAGIIMFVSAVVSFLFAPLSGRIAAAMGARTALLIGITLSFVGYLSLFWAHHNLMGFIAASLAITLGIMFTYTSFPNLVAEAVPEENTSEGMGINAVARTVFMAIGTAVVTMALASSEVSETGVPTESAFQLVYGIILAACAASFVVAYLIKANHRPVPSEEEQQPQSVAAFDP